MRQSISGWSKTRLDWFTPLIDSPISQVWITHIDQSWDSGDSSSSRSDHVSKYYSVIGGRKREDIEHTIIHVDPPNTLSQQLHTNQQWLTSFYLFPWILMFNNVQLTFRSKIVESLEQGSVIVYVSAWVEIFRQDHSHYSPFPEYLLYWSILINIYLQKW